MIEDIFGKVTWPVAVLVVALAALVAFGIYTDGEHDHERDMRIVEECAGEENPTRCAEQIKEAL